MDCRETADVVAREHGNIHRSQRPGAAALVRLLERCDAIRKPERFAEILLACECDARGRLGFEESAYPQRPRLLAALAAVQSVVTREIAAQAAARGQRPAGGCADPPGIGGGRGAMAQRAHRTLKAALTSAASVAPGLPQRGRNGHAHHVPHGQKRGGHLRAMCRAYTSAPAHLPASQRPHRPTPVAWGGALQRQKPATNAGTDSAAILNRQVRQVLPGSAAYARPQAPATKPQRHGPQHQRRHRQPQHRMAQRHARRTMRRSSASRRQPAQQQTPACPRTWAAPWSPTDQAAGRTAPASAPRRRQCPPALATANRCSMAVRCTGRSSVANRWINSSVFMPFP